MEGLIVLFKSLTGIGALCVFFGTIAMVGECVDTYGIIQQVYSVTRDRCIAVVKYHDLNNNDKEGWVTTSCHQWEQQYYQVIPIKYGLWTPELISTGHPIISFSDALMLNKLGIFLMMCSIPCVAIAKKENQKEKNIMELASIKTM